MTQEEKAKAYDEALEKARMYRDNAKAVEEYAAVARYENIFPQLCESEDERIRKELIEYLRGDLDDITTDDTDRWITWIEKQEDCILVPKSHLDPVGKPGVDGMKILEKQKEPENTSASTIIPSCWEVEQKEQKSAEKQDYSGLTDLERAIHRGFLSVGVENVPVTVIKETAKDCLAQMKPVWSEEDEKIRQKLIRFISSPNIEGFMLASDEQMFVSWLKSLRPMPKVAVADGVLWKPSEEQLEALNVLLCTGDFSYVGQATKLQELYIELKKL